MNTQDPPPPPPPPPPPGSQDFQDPFADTVDTSSLDQGKPAVAAAPGRVLVVLAILVLFVTFVIFQLFIFEDEPEPQIYEGVVDVTPAEEEPVIPDIGAGLAPPPPPVPLPPEIPQPNIPMVEPAVDGPTNELRLQRIRSGMLIASSGGGDGLLDGFGGQDAAPATDDPNLEFANRVYASNTKAQTATATHIGNLNNTIAQGRIVQASLETAINTQLPGNIRAIVSRDIYGEAGTDPLIPKGSRLIGQYNASLFAGQSRVYVVWTRVIRPDGVDVAINSPLIDQIGQAGVAGHVDSKFGEIFARALLVSTISIAAAAAIDEVNGNPNQTQTTNTDGSVTTNADLTTQASIQSIQEFGATMSGFLRRFLDVQPTILVDQGTPVNVFVNRDLIFPGRYTGARFIP